MTNPTKSAAEQEGDTPQTQTNRYRETKMARAVMIGILVLFAILVMFEIKGCVDKHASRKRTVTEVEATTPSSEQSPYRVAITDTCKVQRTEEISNGVWRVYLYKEIHKPNTVLRSDKNEAAVKRVIIDYEVLSHVAMSPGDEVALATITLDSGQTVRTAVEVSKLNGMLSPTTVPPPPPGR